MIIEYYCELNVIRKFDVIMCKQYPCLNCIRTTVIVIVIVTTGASYVGELLKVNNSLQELGMRDN